MNLINVKSSSFRALLLSVFLLLVSQLNATPNENTYELKAINKRNLVNDVIYTFDKTIEPRQNRSPNSYHHPNSHQKISTHSLKINDVFIENDELFFW